MKLKIWERYLEAVAFHNKTKRHLYFRAWEQAQNFKLMLPDYSATFEAHFEDIFNAPSTVRRDDRPQSSAVPPDDVPKT